MYFKRVNEHRITLWSWIHLNHGSEFFHAKKLCESFQPASYLAQYDISSVSRRGASRSSRQVYWSDNGELVCIATEDEAFMLRYNADNVEGTPPDEDGFEEAFDVVGEVSDKVMTG